MLIVILEEIIKHNWALKRKIKNQPIFSAPSSSFTNIPYLCFLFGQVAIMHSYFSVRTAFLQKKKIKNQNLPSESAVSAPHLEGSGSLTHLQDFLGVMEPLEKDGSSFSLFFIIYKQLFLSFWCFLMSQWARGANVGVSEELLGEVKLQIPSQHLVPW